jgi:uroporphyrinogen decarboxylase
VTQLEEFRATVAHEPHGSFLWQASFTPDLERRVRQRYGLADDASLPRALCMFDPGHLPLVPAGSAPAPDFSRYFADYAKPEGSFINSLGVLEVPAKFHHFTGYVSPLRNAGSLKEIEDFPFPRAGGFEEAGMKERVRQVHEQGRVAAAWAGHMYENAWQVRGYEEFLVDMIERPAWCECILDRFMERNLKIAEAAARAGADLLRTGDDVANQNAMMFSMLAWRGFIKSRWARVYAAARAIKPDIAIWYHSDGNIEAIIPELIEIGVTILNPVQPECMDAVKLKDMYGRSLVFDGTIGTQSTMPFGTVDEVRRVVRRNREKLGYDGALVLAPTHVLEPEVPLENIEAFREEAARPGPD